MNDPNAMPMMTPEGLVGHTLADRYKVIKILGEGGMGSVYLGEHVTLRKRVAIKVLHQELCRDQTQVDRFLQEARAASMIGHENIVDIVDFGPVPGGSVFFAMEMLEGEDLADLIKREGKLRWARTRGLTLQILLALGAAHSKGIIHRDLKPANCFLVKRSDGRDFVKLLDFGIAKVNDPESGDGGGLTRTGAVFGTAKYMAPEQACGEPADARTDVYAAAICMYEFLTGQVPYDGDNFMRVLSRHLTEPLTPPSTMAPDADISPAVEAVIVKALSKKPDDRYQTMEEFAAAVESIGPDGNLAAGAYAGPMAVGPGAAQANAGATMFLADGGVPGQAPEAPRGGTLMLDPGEAPDLEFGTVRLDPGEWPQDGSSRPPSGVRPATGVRPPSGVMRPATGAPPGMAGAPGTNPPGHAGMATNPPMGPATSPAATHGPSGGGDYTMFATEKRSPAKFAMLLLAGAIVAIGGGGVAAWLLLGGDDEPTDEVAQVDKDDDGKKKKDVKPAADPPDDPPEEEVKPLIIPDDPPETPEIVPEEAPEDPPEDPPEVEEPKPEPRTTKSKSRPRPPRTPRKPREDKVKDSLSASDASKGFAKASAAVKKCKQGIPGMTIKIKADIRADGTVAGAKALTQKHIPKLTACVVKAVKANARFAKTKKIFDAKSHTFKF